MAHEIIKISVQCRERSIEKCQIIIIVEYPGLSETPGLHDYMHCCTTPLTIERIENPIMKVDSNV